MTMRGNAMRHGVDVYREHGIDEASIVRAALDLAGSAA